jgi:hypothetical protein
MADQEETPGLAAGPPLAADAKQGDVPKLKSKAFRSKLLSRLPRLAVATWEAGDTLDVYKDFRSVVDLDADSFLRPLAPLAEDRRE